MGLFGRRRKADPATDDVLADAAAEDLDASGLEDEPLEDHGDRDDRAEPEDVEPEDDEADEDHEMERPHSRVRGPFDRSEVDSADGYLDLGSLWVPAVDGMHVRLELDDASQTILGVQVLLGESVVQLQAYAAPRTFGVWREIRTEISQSVLAQGGKVSVDDGPFGKQLTARLPNGSGMRFIGVDGPRWFLRGVLSGPAADDDGAAESLVEVIRKVVVVRGADAMPPRELLPMTMPVVSETPEALEDAEETPDPDDARTGGEPDRSGRYRGEDISPFARGPEITEVR